MSFYDFVSMFLTVLGNIVLIYRMVFQLESGSGRKSIEEKMCTKWVIFTIFLKVQYYILAILEIIPLGALALLIIKMLLFLPENAISTMIYKKIQKKLEKVSLDEYNTQFSKYISFLLKHLIILLMKTIKKISPYINSQDIQQTQEQILEIIKILEYKKAAVGLKRQVVASQIGNDLNTSSDYSITTDQEHMASMTEIKEAENQEKQFKKSSIGNQMSKILADLDEDQTVWNLKGDLMVVKGNKNLGIKSRFQEVKVQFFVSTFKINVIDKNKATNSFTLKEIKWVTKDMMNIELVYDDGRSNVVRLKQKQDVARWVEPICLQIAKKKKKSIKA